MGQTELGGFVGDDGEATRPADEAEHVAGNGGGAATVVDAESVRFPDADGAVTLSVTQVDYTVEGRGDDEFPVVHVFGRRVEDGGASAGIGDDDGDHPPLEHVEVYDFKPYFYAPVENVDDERIASYDRLTGYEETDADGEPYESIRGERLVKIFGQTPRDVGQIRDEFDHYEADILFPNRLLIDKDIESGVRVPERRLDDGNIRVPHQEVEAVDATVDPRVNTFDIEVDDRNGFPEDGEQTIVCLTSHDSYDDEYVTWLYQSPAGVNGPAALEAYDPIEDDFEADVRVFDEEEAMLAAFADYIEDETDPDIFTGWNCLPADTSISMADGTDRAIRDVEVGDSVVGSSDQQSTTAEVTNKWQSEKQVFELELADDTTLRTSGEHRVMVGDDDTIDWKDGRDIEAGDFLVKPRKLRVEDESVPELSELVPIETQRFGDDTVVREFKSELPYGAVTDLADRFDVATGTLHHPKTDIWTPERCRVASEEYEVPVPDGGREYRRTRVPLDRELDEHEMYLAGLVLTDGSMSQNDGIRFYNTREELHDQFPGESHLEPDGKGCYKQNVLDYASMYAFNGLGIPFGDKNDGDVDLSTVYEMPERYIGNFLAGAIDGDGNVSSSVTVAAENRSIGRWYVKLFRRLGIYAEQREHIVRVPSTERDLESLRELVLPYMSHSEKSSRIAELEGGKSGRTENIPFALFEAERGSDERRIGRDKHRRGINLKRHDTDLDDWNEYVFVEVTDVATAGTETTYDIETTTHNFVAEDCLVHNCDDFDAPYLLDRMEELQGPHHDHNLDIDRLSRVNEVWRSDWNGPDIKGRVVFDLLRAYKATQFSELESYRLDAVGEVELGVGKERYPGDIGDLWEDDPERLLEYNLRDVELCVELDRKQDIVAFFREIASFVGCKLEDAPTAGDAVDMYVLHKAHGDFALPSKGTVESGEEFEGGAVFEPITGVRENVSVLDLKSLYPMCMWTTNASPETKVDPDEYDGDTYRTPTGQHFRTDPAGMMREMIDELLTEREEKKELRNSHQPDTEDYERYDRQQASVKVVMNCFTPDTDVLTPDGIRGIRDLDLGDEVYSLDPETMRMEVKPVVETQAYPDYEGELVDIETGKIDFSVTPNHRMLVRKDETNGISWGEDDYRFVEAGDLERGTNYQLPHDWDGPEGDRIDEIDLTERLDDYQVWVRPEVHGHTFAAEIGYYPDKVKKKDVGKEGYVFEADEFEEHREYIDEVAQQCFVHAEANRKWIPRSYDGDDFLELLAWYVTEGNVYTSDDKQFGDTLRGSATTVKIAQDAPVAGDGGAAETVTESDHAAIGSLLDRMGFDYYADDQSYQFTSRLLGRYLERECGDDSFAKRIPEFVFDASRDQKRRFLETLIDGDGDRQTNSWRYSTASDELRDDVLRLCAHLGLTTNYREDSGVWRIYVTEDSKNTLRMNRSASRSSAENGVYCVTVEDNHTLLAGRNGKFQFVGQSLYGVSGWDRFRLYDKDSAAAVTATGREVINYTQEIVSEFGYDVVYGDTDSVMISLSGDNSTGEVIERSFELEERINGSYDEFAREELDADEHRFQIEFEKLYRRFFQAGKKKRYAGHIVWKEGKDVDDIDITGFEYQRSDIAPITKEVQLEVIEMIVHGVDIETVKDYVHGVIEDFDEEGAVALEDIGIPGGIGKKLDNYDTDTAQVRGAKYANLLLGTNFGNGSKPKRLYLKKVHPSFFRRVEEEMDLDPAEDVLYGEFKRDPDVICFEYEDQIPEEFEVDWDKMLDKTLKGPIARILEALDVSWEEVKSGQEQTGLGSFM
jgi:DNA polymerase I